MRRQARWLSRFLSLPFGSLEHAACSRSTPDILPDYARPTGVTEVEAYGDVALRPNRRLWTDLHEGLLRHRTVPAMLLIRTEVEERGFWR